MHGGPDIRWSLPAFHTILARPFSFGAELFGYLLEGWLEWMRAGRALVGRVPFVLTGILAHSTRLRVGR